MQMDHMPYLTGGILQVIPTFQWYIPATSGLPQALYFKWYLPHSQLVFHVILSLQVVILVIDA